MQHAFSITQGHLIAIHDCCNYYFYTGLFKFGKAFFLYFTFHLHGLNSVLFLDLWGHKKQVRVNWNGGNSQNGSNVYGHPDHFTQQKSHTDDATVANPCCHILNSFAKSFPISVEDDMLTFIAFI